MEATIQLQLAKIEKEQEIKILLACETGSRAWGFPSPDSDFDIRMIYMHKRDWYLSLKEKKDSIDLMLENNNLDISGWDLRKSLRLLSRSNGPLLERLQSPIVYGQDDAFVKGINDLMQNQYSRIAVMHHYLSMAKKFYSAIKNAESYKLKTFFYALRCATACKWVLTKDEVPPIEFPKMIEKIQIEAGSLARVFELIKLKSEKGESYLHKGESLLKDYIGGCILEAEQGGKFLPGSKGSWDELDRFFLTRLHSYY